MKNKALVLTFCLVLFSGCANSSSPTSDKVQLSLLQEKRMGVLQSLGGTFTSSKATDLLKMVDGKTIFLRSSVIDLSSSKYQGKEVEVMGEITRTTDGNQTMNVVSIDVVDTEVSTNQDVPVWVDNSSDNLGLSLKYRNDFDFSDSNNAITITAKPKTTADTATNTAEPQKPAEIKLELLSKDSNFDLAGAMKVASLSSADVLAGGYNKSKITQEGLDAFKKAADGGKEVDYYFKNPEGAYKISFTAGDNPADLTSDQNMFYSVLASVDFGGGGSGSGTSPTGTQSNSTNELNGSSSTVTNAATDTQNVDGNLSVGTVTGFEKFTSDNQKFSIQYPKSYYFGSVEPSSGAVKSYQFGSQPLETAPGEMVLDLLNSVPSGGSQVEYSGVSMTRFKSDSGVSLYLDKNGKVFKISGPSAKEGLMQQMLSTIQS